jgi:hypothetical protein
LQTNCYFLYFTKKCIDVFKAENWRANSHIFAAVISALFCTAASLLTPPLASLDYVEGRGRGRGGHNIFCSNTAALFWAPNFRRLK